MWLGADVISSSPAARQFFFMYFPLTHSVSFFFYIYIFFSDNGYPSQVVEKAILEVMQRMSGRSECEQIRQTVREVSASANRGGAEPLSQSVLSKLFSSVCVIPHYYDGGFLCFWRPSQSSTMMRDVALSASAQRVSRAAILCGYGVLLILSYTSKMNNSPPYWQIAAR